MPLNGAEFVYKTVWELTGPGHKQVSHWLLFVPIIREYTASYTVYRPLIEKQACRYVAELLVVPFYLWWQDRWLYWKHLTQLFCYLKYPRKFCASAKATMCNNARNKTDTISKRIMASQINISIIIILVTLRNNFFQVHMFVRFRANSCPA